MSTMATMATTTTPPPEYVHRAAWKAGVLGALNALSLILAVRLTLLCAVSGAFVLAYLAIQNATPYQSLVLVIYTAVVVVPLIWLAAHK